jgi:Co/Zn/Cd efflux system component
MPFGGMRFYGLSSREAVMTDCGCELEGENDAQRKTLRVVLAINSAMFCIELAVGLLASSTGLIADSLDMLADASVYAISLYAVGRAEIIRVRAATVSGTLQIVLGVGVLLEAVRRFLGDSEPLGTAMISTGFLAFAANAICLKLISRHKGGDINFRASYIFSANDVIANIGVIVSGILVLLLGSQLPDLMIAVLIAGIVVRGGVNILRDVHRRKE